MDAGNFNWRSYAYGSSVLVCFKSRRPGPNNSLLQYSTIVSRGIATRLPCWCMPKQTVLLQMLGWIDQRFLCQLMWSSCLPPARHHCSKKVSYYIIAFHDSTVTTCRNVAGLRSELTRIRFLGSGFPGEVKNRRRNLSNIKLLHPVCSHLFRRVWTDIQTVSQSQYSAVIFIDARSHPILSCNGSRKKQYCFSLWGPSSLLLSSSN